MLRLSFLFMTISGIASVAAAADEMSAKNDAKTSFHFHVRIENVSTATTLRSSSGGTAPAPNSPGLWVVQTGKHVLFTTGKHDRGVGLEAQAEDGNPGPLAEAVKTAKNVVASGVFNTPVGDDNPGPALPGKAYEFTFQANPDSD